LVAEYAIFKRMWENHERMGGGEEQQYGKKIRPLPASTCVCGGGDEIGIVSSPSSSGRWWEVDCSGASGGGGTRGTWRARGMQSTASSARGRSRSA
jgi:hypothetical protein